MKQQLIYKNDGSFNLFWKQFSVCTLESKTYFEDKAVKNKKTYLKIQNFIKLKPKIGWFAAKYSKKSSAAIKLSVLVDQYLTTKNRKKLENLFVIQNFLKLGTLDRCGFQEIQKLTFSKHSNVQLQTSS